MSYIKTPVKGMNDFLPDEARLRDYLMSLIKGVYASYGFSPIETPAVEHIENLTSKQGGENEKLIFKILKRGEKLALNGDTSEDDIVDSGLRYDLTVPLSRYYANNSARLITPFKALQIGNVWRADRPQKGRFRQFTQCDIDILGDESSMAEIELILATTTLLSRLGFTGFKVRLNDRRILRAMALYSGFNDGDLGRVLIILDKLDKIGTDGVYDELIASGFPGENVKKYLALFEGKGDASSLHLGEFLPPLVVQGVDDIISAVKDASDGDFALVFDPTLVRGMAYYTGTIFEIEMPELNASVAGGGRYDEMIGKFTGQKVPACGFSIGFERIVTILKDRGYMIPGNKERVAFLYDKDITKETRLKMLKDASALRQTGVTVLISAKSKNARHQREMLSSDGITEFKNY